MPVITNGSELPILPAGYSPEALGRDCIELGSARTMTNKLVRFYIENANSYACVVDAELNDKGRHEVITKLEFNDDRNNLVSVSDFFEAEEYQQVELVATSKKVRNSGIATALYELIVCVRGIKIVSDFEQYEGGKAIWKKLAERGVVDVFVWNTTDNSLNKYDGSNIDEDSIWSLDPDRSKERVLLKARKID